MFKKELTDSLLCYQPYCALLKHFITGYYLASLNWEWLVVDESS